MACFHLATQLKETFTKFELRHVVKENNERDNLLSRLASTRNNRQHRTIIQETISESSLNKMVMSVTIVDRNEEIRTAGAQHNPRILFRFVLSDIFC